MSAPLHEARRKPLSTPATLTFHAGAVRVRTIDVSQVGMSVSAQVKLPAGLTCTIDVRLPAAGGPGRRALLQGQVTNCVLGRAGFRIGLQFTALSGDAEAAIADCMKA